MGYGRLFVKTFLSTTVAASIATGGLYYYGTQENLNHICRTQGNNLPLPGTARFLNFLGSTVLNNSTKLLTTEFPREYVNEEASILSNVTTNNSAKSLEEFVDQELAFNEFFQHIINDSGYYSPLGRAVEIGSTEEKIKARKSVIEYVKQHPEILQSPPIDDNNRLLVITGMHRTGSTLLQNLLSLDDASRTTLCWEMYLPIPPAQSEEELTTTNRIETINNTLSKIELVCPNYLSELRKVHNFFPHLPEEDTLILFQQFVNYPISNFIQNDREQLLQYYHTRSRYYLRYLHLYFKVLNSGVAPKSHWLTKNPDHCRNLVSFVEEFPKANIIMTHRDPAAVVPSWFLLHIFSQHVFIYNDFVENPDFTVRNFSLRIAEHCSFEANSIVEGRKKLKEINSANEARILDVAFSNIVQKPVETVEAIYKHFGYKFTPEHKEKIVDYMQKTKGSSVVKRSLADLELSKEDIDALFSHYYALYSKYF